jgi:hypothetical protein
MVVDIPDGGRTTYRTDGVDGVGQGSSKETHIPATSKTGFEVAKVYILGLMATDMTGGGKTAYCTGGVVGWVLVNRKGRVIPEASVMDCPVVRERTYGPMGQSTLVLGRMAKSTVPEPNLMLLELCALKALGLREIQ